MLKRAIVLRKFLKIKHYNIVRMIQFENPESVKIVHHALTDSNWINGKSKEKIGRLRRTKGILHSKETKIALFVAKRN